MNDLIDKFKKIQQNLYELKIQFSTNDVLYNKFTLMILEGYDFDYELKLELINNMDIILITADRFKKIIKTSECENYTKDQLIEILNIKMIRLVLN